MELPCLNGAARTFTVNTDKLKDVAAAVRNKFIAAVFGTKPDGYVYLVVTSGRTASAMTTLHRG